MGTSVAKRLVGVVALGCVFVLIFFAVPLFFQWTYGVGPYEPIRETQSFAILKLILVSGVSLFPVLYIMTTVDSLGEVGT